MRKRDRIRLAGALGIIAQPARALLMLARYEDAGCDFDLDEPGREGGAAENDVWDRDER